MCACVCSVHVCGCEPVCICCEIRIHVCDCPVCVWGEGCAAYLNPDPSDALPCPRSHSTLHTYRVSRDRGLSCILPAVQVCQQLAPFQNLQSQIGTLKLEDDSRLLFMLPFPSIKAFLLPLGLHVSPSGVWDHRGNDVNRRCRAGEGLEL